MGWTMNDLRNQNRNLAPVRELGPSTGEVVANPGGARSRKRRPSDNPAPADRLPLAARQPEAKAGHVRDEQAKAEHGKVENRAGEPDPEAESLSFPVSRGLDSMTVSARSAESEAIETDRGDEAASTKADQTSQRRVDRRRNAGHEGPESRPAKHRDASYEPEDEAEESFSWSFKYDEDDEQPEGLQAKSPLLSRAFRSSVG